MDTTINIPSSTTSPTSRIISPIALTPTGASPSTTSSQEARTSWYNYTLASAGTITGTNNTTTATQSICPKGWTLPSKEQAQSVGPDTGSIAYIASFSPVLGGFYNNGTLGSGSTYGFWWGSTALNGTRRYRLSYDGSSLYTYDSGRRSDGLYVRCVQAS